MPPVTMTQVWDEACAVAKLIERRTWGTEMLLLHLNVPVVQLSQETLPTSLKVPGTHVLHTELPADENVSAVQLVHDSMVLAPVVSENIPAGHSSH